ncbi:MAG: hypothetical protein OXN17_00120 [Candidatus Poribacteria bacterium]|nr:hypothetical protein [Candidatus Poribacteria bacterium]MDE0505786.1 hypothetical protein [Candidatus Poribacteria bacterium]
MRHELKFHHMSIPTDVPRENETYVEAFKVHISGLDGNPYRVDWLRFEPDSPLPDILKTLPHVAYVVDDIEVAIADAEVIVAPTTPIEGVTVAYIVHDGAPIEFLQFHRAESQSA